MAIEGLDYWYDGQQRRFLEQVVRAFSGFKYSTGMRNGVQEIRTVPCRMASRDRMVGNIMRNNSENTLLTCPLITVEQSGLAIRRADLHNPAHIDTKSVHERAVDPVTGRYTNEMGNRYSVERMAPRPFEMTIQVDLWTSNMDQKHQLSEQMLVVFMPDIQIQNGENPLDWTARTTLNLDDIQWSSRSIPIGTENEIEVFTMTFKLPFWLSPPARVTQERIIHQVITNINSGVEDSEGNLVSGDTMSRVITTPGDHWIDVDTKASTLRLLGPGRSKLDPSGEPYSWDKLLTQYGKVRPMQSEIRIKRDGDIEGTAEIIGTIEFDLGRPDILFWNIDPDTLPTNTMTPITGIIDPLQHAPGENLPYAELGTRYLFLSDIEGPTRAWGNLAARENDIVQFMGGTQGWQVVFRAADYPTTTHYVVNLKSSSQLHWTGSQWQLALGGEYAPGLWRVGL